jgi:hypothetical protein
MGTADQWEVAVDKAIMEEEWEEDHLVEEVRNTYLF